MSQPLKKLERDGRVERQVHPAVPPTVEYALTELGATLGGTVEQLAHWAESNMPAIEKARRC
nr:helix-turn-helix domain-containing protein [Pseudomonas peradeniyensis]